MPIELLMAVMRALIAAGTVILLGAGFAARAEACSCGSSGPPCQNYFQVDAVFSGTVRSISAIEVKEDPPYDFVRRERLVRFTVDAQKLVHPLQVQTDAMGHFEFAEVAAGRYVIRVGLTRTSERAAYPRVFYPGTRTPGEATVIELREGTHQELEPLKLPPALNPYELTGVVVWPDGSPAAGAVVDLLDGDAPWRRLVTSASADRDGRFAFKVYESLRYIVNAFIADPIDERRVARAAGVPIVGSAGLAPLRIVLPAR